MITTKMLLYKNATNYHNIFTTKMHFITFNSKRQLNFTNIFKCDGWRWLCNGMANIEIRGWVLGSASLLSYATTFWFRPFWCELELKKHSHQHSRRFTCRFRDLPSLSRRSERRREHFAESSYTTQLRVQTMHNTRIVLPVARAEICLGCRRDRPFLNRTHLVFDEVIPNEVIYGIRRVYSGSWQHDRTPTKTASAKNFPATVVMPSAWPDWSKFQFLRSWHDPAEIRTTRTTTYQTWSERSNH